MGMGEALMAAASSLRQGGNGSSQPDRGPHHTAEPIYKETTGGFAFASKRIGQLTAKRLPEEAEGGQRDVIFLLREPLSTGALRTEIQTRKLILEEFSVLIL